MIRRPPRSTLTDTLFPYTTLSRSISRMPIKATRALLNAALDGSLNDAEFRKDPNFGFEFPVAVPGVDSAILDPRNAWADKAAYDRTAQTLVQQFIDNFAEFAEHVDEGVRQAARSEEHTSELQSLMRISYAVFCLKKKTNKHTSRRP